MFSRIYGAQPGQSGRFPATQSADNSVDRAIELIGGITGNPSVFSGHFSHEIRFFHLPGQYHATVRLDV
jgi:hypothetical protein